MDSVAALLVGMQVIPKESENISWDNAPKRYDLKQRHWQVQEIILVATGLAAPNKSDVRLWGSNLS